MLRNLAATAALSTLACAAHAAPVSLADMTLNGDAALTADGIVLTESSGFDRGSAFIATPTPIEAGTGFSAYFEVSISDSRFTGADGLAFVIHNDGAGDTALGGSGAGIGYQGIDDSLILEFDTYRNFLLGDPNGNHVGLNLNGSRTSEVTANPGFGLETASSIYTWVDYDGTTLEVFVNDTATKSGAALLTSLVDLVDITGLQAYFGFTAATGAARSEHLLREFKLDIIAPVPLPASVPLLTAGLAAMGWVSRRRRAS